MNYSVVLLVNGQEFVSAGETLEKALLGIAPPAKIVTKAILRVTIDGKIKERLVKPHQVAKLFSDNPVIREMVLKNFKILFDL